MKNLIFLLLLLGTHGSLFSQSNIQQTLSVNGSGAAADASAQLDVSATDKGMLVPRMTSGQRTVIASPATGLLVFDTTTGGFWFYNGTVWQDLSAPKTLKDADGDTKIQVEENTDEDIIRFDLGGTEGMVLQKNSAGIPRLEFTNSLSNTFIGRDAGANNTTGNDNTASGTEALYSNTAGSYNTAGGRQALYSNTTGYSNVAIGIRALYSNTVRSNLVAVGDSALYNNGLGVSFSIEATGNTALGSKALYSNTTGYDNTASGSFALRSNMTGYDNTASGFLALRFNTDGSYNTASGSSALYSNTDGRFNTASGYTALSSNTTGDYNTALGYDAEVSTSNLTNATAIGARAEVGASNSLVLGSISGVNLATASVNVGIGTTTPSERLEVALGNVFASNGDFYAATGNGVINAGGGIMDADLNVIADAVPVPMNVSGDEDLYISDDLELGSQGYKPGGGDWAAASDARLKKDISPYTDGLEQVLQIKPVRYRYNDVFPIPDGGREYVGVLAQDVLPVAPYMVELKPFGQKTSEDEHGVEHIIKPGTPYYTYDGSALTYMLINAVKEQQTEIETLKSVQAENAALKSQLDKITAALAGAGISVEK